jgi:hypothetical protein
MTVVRLAVGDRDYLFFFDGQEWLWQSLDAIQKQAGLRLPEKIAIEGVWGTWIYGK